MVNRPGVSAALAVALACLAVVASAELTSANRKLLQDPVPGNYACSTLGAPCTNTAYYYDNVCYSASTCVAYNYGKYCHATTFNDGASCNIAGQTCLKDFTCKDGLCYGAPKCALGSSCDPANGGVCGGPINTPVAANEFIFGKSRVATVQFVSSSAVYNDKLFVKFRDAEKEVVLPKDGTPVLLGWLGQYDKVNFSIKVYDQTGAFRDQWFDDNAAQAKRFYDAGSRCAIIQFEDRRPAEPDMPEMPQDPKDYNDLVIQVCGVRTGN